MENSINIKRGKFIFDAPVTSIGNKAFSYRKSLTSIVIPNSVTSIEDRAFSGCSSLTSVTIPNSVTSIGDSAFYDTGIYNDVSNFENGVLYIDNCLVNTRGLLSTSDACTIKENTRLIADGAFYKSRYTSITIPNSVTWIGESAFTLCLDLTSINVSDNNSNYSSVDGVLFNKDKTMLIKCPERKSDMYTIPNSVTSIGYMAFRYCSLTSIIIPDSVTSIGEWAFAGCSGLTSVTIPNGVTSIGDSAFLVCFSLTSITIPNSVTSIGDNAFYNCFSLTSVIFKGTTSEWGSIKKGQNYDYNVTSAKVQCSNGQAYF